MVSVNILNNNIGNEQAQNLIVILKEHATLKSLCGNKGDETELDMSGKKMGVEGAIMLAPEIITNGALAKFDISSNNLGAQGFKQLAEGLRAHKTLTELNVASNYATSTMDGTGNTNMEGVGAFADCAAGLAALDGMTDALSEAVLDGGKPFLGICVGMQLLATTGHERVVTSGLNWLPGQVQKLDVDSATHKIPHMGWNMLDVVNGHKVLEGLEGEAVYFVHSFAFCPDDENNCLATTTHGASFAATVGRDNIIGTQFHPEKSQHVGLRLIKNFLEWRP